MGGVRTYLLPLVMALAFASTAVRAADYPQPPPPYIPPPPVEVFSGWYLRGDIGITNQKLKDMTNVLDVNNTVKNVGFGFDSSGLFGLGIGYYWNDWLRFDLTGEYRSKANFHGTQIIRSGGSTYTDEYTFSKSEWLFLANFYVDIGTWYSLTPFVGAGIGMTRNTIHSFQDVNTPNHGVAFADDASMWNFAWALHAGLAYKVSKNFIVEFSYRYLDLGNAKSGDIYTYLGTNNVNNPMELHHLTSHDFRVGLRMNLDGFGDFSHRHPHTTYYAQAPVYAQQPTYAAPVYAQQPTYAPPPVYAQPQVYAPPQYAQPQVYNPAVRGRY